MLIICDTNIEYRRIILFLDSQPQNNIKRQLNKHLPYFEITTVIIISNMLKNVNDVKVAPFSRHRGRCKRNRKLSRSTCMLKARKEAFSTAVSFKKCTRLSYFNKSFLNIYNGYLYHAHRIECVPSENCLCLGFFLLFPRL